MNLEEGNLEWAGSQRRVGLGLGLRGAADGARRQAEPPRPDRWLGPQAKRWAHY